MPRAIAFYLPQYYPTPENDLWWGKGFTEWTNVGRAKPLFQGHYQPRVPADLGYYDLRIPEVRLQQAALAREAGIEGFCYWHYWFAGRRLLDRVFSEVLESREPDFPFCLCWANHSWKAKTWDPNIPDKMLMEQTYPGRQDYEAHFRAMLPAFKDKRYMTNRDGRLIFAIFDPGAIPDMQEMSDIWNGLAKENGLPGFLFLGFAQGVENIKKAERPGIDKVVYDAMFDAVYINNERWKERIKAKYRTVMNLPNPLDYKSYTKIALSQFKSYRRTIHCIDPNFDHSPRSGAKGPILHNSSPEKWEFFCKEAAKLVIESDDEQFIFIKSWNEWGEGNYLEPDLRYGTKYIKATKRGLFG